MVDLEQFRNIVRECIKNPILGALIMYDERISQHYLDDVYNALMYEDFGNFESGDGQNFAYVFCKAYEHAKKIIQEQDITIYGTHFIEHKDGVQSRTNIGKIGDGDLYFTEFFDGYDRHCNSAIILPNLSKDVVFNILSSKSKDLDFKLTEEGRLFMAQNRRKKLLTRIGDERDTIALKTNEPFVKEEDYER